MNKNLIIGVASAITIAAAAAVGSGVLQKSDKDTYYKRVSNEVKLDENSGQLILNHFSDYKPQIADKLTCSIDISGNGTCSWHGWVKIEKPEKDSFDVVKLQKNIEPTSENIRSAAKIERRSRAINGRRERGVRP